MTRKVRVIGRKVRVRKHKPVKPGSKVRVIGRKVRVKRRK